jgi:hypothetical protein
VVERAGTDVIAVVSEFLEHPLADDFTLGGMMQHMHLPKREQDFAVDELEVHGGG